MLGVGDAAVGDVAEAVQNKLTIVIVEGEIALELAEGPARERLKRVLAAAWQASRLLRELTPAHAPLRAAS
jgi:hypothetical protein